MNVKMQKRFILSRS